MGSSFELASVYVDSNLRRSFSNKGTNDPSLVYSHIHYQAAPKTILGVGLLSQLFSLPIWDFGRYSDRSPASHETLPALPRIEPSFG